MRQPKLSKDAPGEMFVGPSGWSYPSWRQTVAVGIPLSRRLQFVGGLFTAVEVNGSFYGQISRSTYASWRQQTPSHFRFAVKGHRFVTHYKRLANCADSIQRLRGQAEGLAEKLAVVLWQLPAHLSVDLQRLDDFLGALGTNWPESRHAIEFRHRSWFTEEVRARLHRARIASCISDAPDFPLWDAVTTDLVYVRLHGHTRKYASSYAAASLRRWAARVQEWTARGLNVHVYFDNDAEGAAIANGITLLRFLGVASTAPPQRSSSEGGQRASLGR